MDKSILKDIKLYSTAELLEELGSRFDHAIFAGTHVLNMFGHVVTEQRYKGSTFYCIGLAEMLKDFMKIQVNNGVNYYEGPTTEDFQ